MENIPQKINKLLSTIRAGILTQRNTSKNTGEMPGDDAMKIYQGMHFTSLEHEHTIQEKLDAFEKYTIDITNETYGLFVFRKNKNKTKVNHLTVFIADKASAHSHGMKAEKAQVIKEYDTKRNNLKKDCHFCGYLCR